RRNRLAVFYNGPHTFARQVGNMRHCILVGVAICGEVPKVRDARDEAAIALAIDHRPVPNSVHAYLYGQPGKMKTDRAAAAMEARATTANRTMPAKASC